MEGYRVNERCAIPEGVGKALFQAAPCKAKCAIATICEYLSMMVEDILKKYQAGIGPAFRQFTIHPYEQSELRLKELFREGWKSVYEVPKYGVFNEQTTEIFEAYEIE